MQLDGVDAVDPRAKQIHMQWDSASARWRLGYSYLRFDTNLESNIYGSGDFYLDMKLSSVQYSADNWQLTAEWVRFTYAVDFLIKKNIPGDIAYLQYNYFLTPAWQVYTRFEYALFDRHHPNGSSLDGLLPRQVGYRRDAGVGVRWDIDDHWMVSAEAHYLEGVLAISINDNPNMFDTKPYWNMVAFEAAFRF
jgi:hypothetical protein